MQFLQNFDEGIDKASATRRVRHAESSDDIMRHRREPTLVWSCFKSLTASPCPVCREDGMVANRKRGFVSLSGKKLKRHCLLIEWVGWRQKSREEVIKAT